MKKQLLSALLTSVLLCGCINTYPKPQPKPQQTAKPKPELLPVNDKIVILSDTIDSLKVQINIEGSETEFSSHIREYVIDKIAEDKAVRVTSVDNGDLILSIKPEFENLDVVGEYYRTNCQVAVTLSNADKQRLFASNHFSFQRAKRVLGAQKAKDQYSQEAGEKIATWCLEKIANLRRFTINASLIRFALRSPGTIATKDQDAKAVVKLGKTIGDMPGIVSYQLAEQDFQQGVCAFRIVYFPEQYPAGLANAISLQL